MSHTLFVANDNDFSAATCGPNQFFVFAFTDTDLESASAYDHSTLGEAATFVAQAFTKQSLKCAESFESNSRDHAKLTELGSRRCPGGVT